MSPASARGSSRAFAWRRSVVGLLIVAGIAGVYLQTAGFTYLSWDDQGYVSKNEKVVRGLTVEGTRWAFTTTRIGNWVPLTWLSHMLVVQFFGLEPGAHHLANVALHAASALVLLGIVETITGSLALAALCALPFALHPLHVESVAWISERKDVLSVLLGLLALGAWVRHLRRPSAGRYLAALGLFLLALLSKPMLVTLPLLLLCLDSWPLGRLTGADGRLAPRTFGRRLLEKVPFFCVSAAYGVMTFVWQTRVGVARPVSDYSIGMRLGNAAVSTVAYLGDLFAPHALSPFYRYPDAIPAWRWGAALLLLVALTILAVTRRRRFPWLLGGWCWYLIALAPVIGLVQVGFQSRADRYAYLPLIGIYLALAAGSVRFAADSRRRRIAVAAAALLALILLSGAAYRQTGWWRDNETLFGRALALDPENWMAHFGLGNALVRAGDIAGSIVHYEAVRRTRPEHVGLALRLGTQYVALGRHAEAAAALAEAVQQEPGSLEANFQYAAALANLGRDAEAIRGYKTILGFAPKNHNARVNLAELLARNGRQIQAEAEYRRALALQPENADSWSGLGVLLAGRGAWSEAADAFTRAMRLRPGDPRFRENLQRLETLRAGKRGSGSATTDR